MEHLWGGLSEIERLRVQARRYGSEVNPNVLLQVQEGGASAKRLQSLYDMLLEMQTSLARDMAMLRRHLSTAGGETERACEARPVAGLSGKECEVLVLFAKGYTYAEAAGLLGCKLATVQTYAKRIYRKLNVHSRAEAIFEARLLGFIHM